MRRLWSAVAVGVLLAQAIGAWELFRTAGQSQAREARLLLVLGITTFLAVMLWLRERAVNRRLSSGARMAGDQLRMAMDSAKVVGWDWDLKAPRTTWLGDWKSLFGSDPDTSVGQREDFFRRVHKDDRDRVWSAVTKAREDRSTYQEKFRVIWPDGTVRWAASSGRFYYAENGEAVRMMGVMADITERTQVEEKLYESQARLASIVESSHDSIISAGLDGTILSWNSGAQRIFGFTEAEMIGKHMAMLVPPGLTDDSAPILKRVGDGEAVESYETVRLTKEGKRVDVSLTVSPVRDFAGTVVGISKMGRDITDRKRAEEALRESEERFRLVANAAPVMIWMSGPDTLCTHFNEPWLAFTGRTLEAEIGKGWIDGVHPVDLERCLDVYTRAFDRRELFRTEYRLRRHDGEYRWILDTGVPRFTTAGSFAGYIGSAIDVTEHKLAEAALSGLSRKLMEAQEEERTRIARELHDDLGQRIVALTMQLHSLGQSLDTVSVETRDRVRDLCNQAVDLERDLQAISHRLHSSKLEYTGLASAVAGFCKELSDQQAVDIDFRHHGIPEGLPKEIALGLFRVLQEALNNAVKHSGVRRFSVALRADRDDIYMEIFDSGIGFDPEAAMRSQGLGLVSMQERLGLVKGEIVFDSRPGAGTRILVRVPLPQSEQPPAPDDDTPTNRREQKPKWTGGEVPEVREARYSLFSKMEQENRSHT